MIAVIRDMGVGAVNAFKIADRVRFLNGIAEPIQNEEFVQ
jgi:hypothetical protein